MCARIVSLLPEHSGKELGFTFTTFTDGVDLEAQRIDGVLVPRVGIGQEARYLPGCLNVPAVTLSPSPTGLSLWVTADRAPRRRGGCCPT